MNQTTRIAGFLHTHPHAATVVFSVCLFAAFVAALEGVFFLLNQYKWPVNTRLGNFPDDLIQKDPTYGYVLAPNQTVRDRLLIGDEEIFDVSYSTDACGRRRTPLDSNDPRSHFAVFFVDSFAFGLGVNDNETLPFYVGQRAKDYMPYNYGAPGYGPQQMLVRLQRGTLRGEIPERTGILVYLWIARHVERVIGTMRTGMWAKDYPCFELVDGDLRNVGTFRENRPILSMMYPTLLKSQTRKYFSLDIPPWITSQNIALTARVICESKREFERQFPDSQFCVLLFPPAGDPYADRLIVHLNECGVRYLDYRCLLPAGPPHFLRDSHPTPACLQRVARLLTNELRISTK